MTYQWYAVFVVNIKKNYLCTQAECAGNKKISLCGGDCWHENVWSRISYQHWWEQCILSGNSSVSLIFVCLIWNVKQFLWKWNFCNVLLKKVTDWIMSVTWYTLCPSGFQDTSQQNAEKVIKLIYCAVTTLQTEIIICLTVYCVIEKASKITPNVGLLLVHAFSHVRAYYSI